MFGHETVSRGPKTRSEKAQGVSFSRGIRWKRRKNAPRRFLRVSEKSEKIEKSEKCGLSNTLNRIRPVQISSSQNPPTPRGHQACDIVGFAPPVVLPRDPRNCNPWGGAPSEVRVCLRLKILRPFPKRKSATKRSKTNRFGVLF